MIKLPPIEKIPEAYTAIEDNRLTVGESEARVKSSSGEKEYTIKWKDNLYYSNDNSTYWQGYIGYPIIAVLMSRGYLPLNREISKYFKNINWNKLNKENKRDYGKTLNYVLENLSKEEKNTINSELTKVFEEIKTLKVEITRKKNLDN